MYHTQTLSVLHADGPNYRTISVIVRVVFVVWPLPDLGDHLRLSQVCKAFRQYYEDTGFFPKACLSLGYGLPAAASSQEGHSPKSFYELVSAVCAAERKCRNDRIKDMGGLGEASISDLAGLIRTDASFFDIQTPCRTSHFRGAKYPVDVCSRIVAGSSTTMAQTSPKQLRMMRIQLGLEGKSSMSILHAYFVEWPWLQLVQLLHSR